MNQTVEYIIDAVQFAGLLGGLIYLFFLLRDEYAERKWRKQWDAENKDWDVINAETIRRILDRTDDWK